MLLYAYKKLSLEPSSETRFAKQLLTKNEKYANLTCMKLIVEIRAAEGGNDAKLLVEDQFSIYEKLGRRECL